MTVKAVVLERYAVYLRKKKEDKNRDKYLNQCDLATATNYVKDIDPVSWQDKILNRITSYLQPKSFLLLAGAIICLVSLSLNIRFSERMQELQDNDIKYRYLLMKGKADYAQLFLDDLLNIRPLFDFNNAT